MFIWSEQESQKWINQVYARCSVNPGSTHMETYKRTMCGTRSLCSISFFWSCLATPTHPSLASQWASRANRHQFSSNLHISCLSSLHHSFLFDVPSYFFHIVTYFIASFDLSLKIDLSWYSEIFSNALKYNYAFLHFISTSWLVKKKITVRSYTAHETAYHLCSSCSHLTSLKNFKRLTGTYTTSGMFCW